MKKKAQHVGTWGIIALIGLMAFVVMFLWSGKSTEKAMNSWDKLTIIGDSGVDVDIDSEDYDEIEERIDACSGGTFSYCKSVIMVMPVENDKDSEYMHIVKSSNGEKSWDLFHIRGYPVTGLFGRVYYLEDKPLIEILKSKELRGAIKIDGVIYAHIPQTADSTETDWRWVIATESDGEIFADNTNQGVEPEYIRKIILLSLYEEATT